jgi:hypothetical protein
LLLLIAAALLGIYDFLPLAEPFAESLEESATNFVLVGYLGLLAAFLVMWFSGTIFTFLNAEEHGERRLSMIAFGGGIGSGIVIGLGFTALLTMAARVGTEDGIIPLESVTLYDFYSTIMGQLVAFTMAVLVGGTAAIAFRADSLPRWFAWLSLLIAIGLVTPIGYIAVTVAMVWLFAFSIYLYRRSV